MAAEETNDPHVQDVIELTNDTPKPTIGSFEIEEQQEPNEELNSSFSSQLLVTRKSPLLTAQATYFEDDSLNSSQIVKPSVRRRQSTFTAFMEQKEASIFSSMMNLSNTILGTGLLGLPYAIAKTGYVLSLVLLIVMATLSFIGLNLSCSAAKVKSPNASYYTLAEMSVPRAKKLVDIAVAVKFCRSHINSVTYSINLHESLSIFIFLCVCAFVCLFVVLV